MEAKKFIIGVIIMAAALVAISTLSKERPAGNSGPRPEKTASDYSGNSDGPKTYAEKKKIAEEMKKIANTLEVKCKYCHVDAGKGLRAGDFTLLTKKGKFSHDIMFPWSEKFNVDCSYCHSGYEELTEKGEISVKHWDYMDKLNEKEGLNLSCESCHIPNKKEKRFSVLTETGRQYRGRMPVAD